MLLFENAFIMMLINMLSSVKLNKISLYDAGQNDMPNKRTKHDDSKFCVL